MSVTRFVLEGEWSGYHGGQRHVCHREVISKKRADAMKVRTIQYTDGTTLSLTVRPAKPREKVELKHQYNSLIRDAEQTGKGFVRVADLS